MTPAHARLLLEALKEHADRTGGDVQAVARVLARLPRSTTWEMRVAREELEAGAVLMRGGFLSPYGRSLAYEVGAAVHHGWALPALPSGRLP
jgi:hypothetical protein